MARRRDWTCPEVAILDRDYPAGVAAAEIAMAVGHPPGEVKRKARERGLRHPAWCSAQAIANFEQAAGRPLAEIAREYRDRRLSRAALAEAIGINPKALREALPDELWQSWPRMTIGRIDAARQRRKAA